MPTYFLYVLGAVIKATGRSSLSSSSTWARCLLSSGGFECGSCFLVSLGFGVVVSWISKVVTGRLQRAGGVWVAFLPQRAAVIELEPGTPSPASAPGTLVGAWHLCLRGQEAAALMERARLSLSGLVLWPVPLLTAGFLPCPRHLQAAWHGTGRPSCSAVAPEPTPALSLRPAGPRPLPEAVPSSPSYASSGVCVFGVLLVQYDVLDTEHFSLSSIKNNNNPSDK